MQLPTKSLTLADLDVCIERLAAQVTSSGFVPSCVLYIERAGRIPGVKIAQRLGCQALPAEASRRGRSLKRRLRYLLSALPASATMLLRNLEVSLGLHESSPERHVVIPEGVAGFRHILIVDDAIDTGQSIVQVKAAIDALPLDEPRTIKVAVITTTAMGGREGAVEPDYALFRRTIVQFPWSSDSAEYRGFLRLYEEIGRTT